MASRRFVEPQALVEAAGAVTLQVQCSIEKTAGFQQGADLVPGGFSSHKGKLPGISFDTGDFSVMTDPHRVQAQGPQASLGPGYARQLALVNSAAIRNAGSQAGGSRRIPVGQALAAGQQAYILLGDATGQVGAAYHFEIIQSAEAWPVIDGVGKVAAFENRMKTAFSRLCA